MNYSDPAINPASLKRQAALEKQLRELARQEISLEEFMFASEEGNQYIAALIDRQMKAQAKTLLQRSAKDEEVGKKVDLFGVENTDPLSLVDQDLNPELDVKTLLILKSLIQAQDQADDVLKKVLQTYGDVSLADDALAYLEKISDDEQIRQVKEARTKLNENFGREIAAGKNIALEARTFAQAGLGNPTALRDLYREITGNPRTPNKLFEELSAQFDFNKLKEVIKFLLHALGRDLKAKGPSISRALLYQLMTETRSLQAILGVYLFFKGRMSLLYRGFDEQDLYYPKQLTFELMAKLFMALIDDRYPSAVKVIKLAEKLGVSQEIIAQILVFTQFRDAVRNVAPKLYRSVQHKQELLNAYMDALEELEEALEQDDDEQKEDK